jgi:hypothetical protein
MNARSAFVLLSLTGLLAAPHARASATFPAQVQSYYGIKQLPVPAPGCRLCHRDDVGGLKTVVTPFGRGLQADGAAAMSIPNLIAALKTNEKDGTDSDGDGTSDADELRAGGDPNVGDRSQPAAEVIPPPETGCSFRSPQGNKNGSCLPLAALLGLMARRRKRRR